MNLKSDYQPAVSIAEAARMLNLGLTKTKELISNGSLRSRKSGRRRLVLSESVLAYLNQTTD